METTTNEIPQKLRKDIEKKILPIAELLRKAGKNDREIEGDIVNHIKAKTKEYYKSKKDLRHIKEFISDAMVSQDADSKIEMIFYDALKRNGIKFKFQYKIRPFRVDYLVSDFLVVELDGPHHGRQKEKDSKRDKYLKKLGYTILRVPVHYLVVDETAVIESIREMSNDITPNHLP